MKPIEDLGDLRGVDRRGHPGRQHIRPAHHRPRSASSTRLTRVDLGIPSPRIAGRQIGDASLDVADVDGIDAGAGGEPPLDRRDLPA